MKNQKWVDFEPRQPGPADSRELNGTCAWDRFQQCATGLEVPYRIGGYLGFAALFAWSESFFILALVAFFALQVVIALVVNSLLQEWLGRCVWAKFQGEKSDESFKAGHQEMQELQQALG